MRKFIENVKIKVTKSISNFFGFFNSYWLLIFLLVLAYMLAFYIANAEEIIKSYKVANNYFDILKYFAKSSQSLIELVFTIFIFKFLLGTKPFKDAIENIFKDIFSNHTFLADVDDEVLIKIAKNISVANPSIEFKDRRKEKSSVEGIESYYRSSKHNHDKNYVVLKSDYITTLFSTGVEINHRKITIKMMENGVFSFKYKFIPPDKDVTNIERYKKDNDRFSEYSYNELLTCSCLENGHPLRSKFRSNVEDIEKDGSKVYWNEIQFYKHYANKDEIIEIEFSITDKFELKNADEAALKEHFESTYIYPHAIRNITFQLEKYKDYKDGIPEMVPTIQVGEEKAPWTYTENIYYKKYHWKVYFSDNNDKIVKFLPIMPS